jgi:hypothetical protein
LLPQLLAVQLRRIQEVGAALPHGGQIAHFLLNGLQQAKARAVRVGAAVGAETVEQYQGTSLQKEERDPLRLPPAVKGKELLPIFRGVEV